jgi:outer membrane lipoprotein SlyB
VKRVHVIAWTAIVLLAGCASAPQGPTVPVMPAPNKPFQVFQEDQSVCQSYAQQVIGPAQQQLQNQQVGSAVIGTVLGAGLGAAVGGGHGAAIGAGAGAVAGTAYGANSAGYESMNMQQRYDMAYSQCMYSRGNQVPGFQPPPNYPYTAPPPPNSGYPPPNYPPPPPQ